MLHNFLSPLADASFAVRVGVIVRDAHNGAAYLQVTRQLDILGKACQELRSSRQLSDLLAHVLAVGNFLNESSGSVSAIGALLLHLAPLIPFPCQSIILCLSNCF